MIRFFQFPVNDFLGKTCRLLKGFLLHDSDTGENGNNRCQTEQKCKTHDYRRNRNRCGERNGLFSGNAENRQQLLSEKDQKDCDSIEA